MNNDITIGLDLGNKKHKVVGLDGRGKVVLKCELNNDKETLGAFFKEHAGATVAMETGTHCRWISSLAKHCGCDAIVGNARKLRAIWESSQKNDWKDAQMIANIARTSRELFHPVSLRDDEHHALVQLIELRDIVVAQRTQAVNAIRGMCKACGYMLPKCDAGGFHRHLDEIPQSEYWKFEPLVDRLESLAENISMYDWKIQDYADVHFKEDVELLRTIPGVGPITSCAYAAFAPNPKKFGSPRDAGCYFGLTAGQDQSGDIDKPKTITKGGNEMMRKLLVTAANYILRESSKDSALKRYGERICARGGKIARRKAKIAVARKLAVVMMAMLQSRKPYQDNLAVRQETEESASI